MAAKLAVKKECLESEVHFEYHGSSKKVLLKDATQEQLAMIKELGIDVFEKTTEKEK